MELKKKKKMPTELCVCSSESEKYFAVNIGRKYYFSYKHKCHTNGIRKHFSCWQPFSFD